ncbi:MAG TPA: hypothetical protein VMS17_21810 [Gemmataceae bacterium]|nr:hypothetical protein [Gemmataceae bacterium]
MLVSILTLALAAPAPEPPDAPKGPAPKVMVLNVDKDGRPYLDGVVTMYKMVTETYTVLLATGKAEARTRQVNVPVTEQRRITLDADGVTVYGADGKKIDAKNLPKIAGPVPILVSTDGKEVDPFYLGLAKQGTLIVVSQALAGAGPMEALPPPKGPETVPPKP